MNDLLCVAYWVREEEKKDVNGEGLYTHTQVHTSRGSQFIL